LGLCVSGEMRCYAGATCGSNVEAWGAGRIGVSGRGSVPTSLPSNRIELAPWSVEVVLIMVQHLIDYRHTLVVLYQAQWGKLAIECVP
jgi:hypothetical protein